MVWTISKCFVPQKSSKKQDITGLICEFSYYHLSQVQDILKQMNQGMLNEAKISCNIV